MRQKTICCPGGSTAIQYASEYLSGLGFQIIPEASRSAAHLLLPVPSFPASEPFIESTLAVLPRNVIISGGNLDSRFPQHVTVDFLKDPYYLAENAAITADCAIRIIKKERSATLSSYPVLIVGWGRIGKCLSCLLQAEGADVTIAARKDSDRAIVRALGCRSISIEDAALELHRYDVILNTVPVMVLPNMNTKADTVILELASMPGMAGANIIDARGLPSKMAPAASGELIAKTFIRLSLGKEV